MLHLNICSFLWSFLVLLVSHFSFLATNLMSSRWVYHHRREKRSHTLENWRLYWDFWDSAHAHACAFRNRKNNTHHHYILLRSLCIITLPLFSRDRGFSCLEIPISAVIWIGFGEGGKRKTTRYLLLVTYSFVLTPLGAACTITLFMLAACDLFKARISTVLLEGIGWMD